MIAMQAHLVGDLTQNYESGHNSLMNLPIDIAADMPIASIITAIIECKKTRVPVTLTDADPDAFAKISWLFRQRGYVCVGQTEQPLTHQFVALDPQKQRIIVAASNDNFHFMQPILKLMRDQGHYVTEINQHQLTEKKLLNALRQCDVAWFEWGDGAIIAASRMPKYCRVICRIHRYELYESHFLEANWENVDEVILVSQSMKQRFIALLGDKLPAHLEITVLANLTEHQPMIKKSVKRNPFHIACVARFAPQKNLIMLLPIMQALVKHDSRYTLFIAGEIEDHCLNDSFIQLIEIYGLQRNIVMCGRLPALEMQKWYATKSFIMSTSYNESQGMGIFEAMLAGLKPVAFHAIGGLSEYLPANYLFKSIDEAVSSVLAGNLAPKDYMVEAKGILRPQELSEQYIKIWQQPDSASPLLSIVIPCFNRERYLLPAVCSALNQRDDNFEVIVVDDGSTDNSLATLAHLNDPRLRIVYKSHTNAPDTRNRGIAEAAGEFIVWLDSDDILHTNALSHYRMLLKRWPQIDIISCAIETLDGEKQYFSLFSHAPQNWLSQLPHGNFITNPGCCVRRSIYHDVGNYDTNYLRAHDYEFWSRALGCAKVAFTSQCNILYRVHESNLTGIGKPNDNTYEYRIFESILQRYPQSDLFPRKNQSEIEAFIQKRRSEIYQETGVDNITIVLDAIGVPFENLIAQAKLLRLQDNKRFNMLIVSDKTLSAAGIPVVLADYIDYTKVKQHLVSKWPNHYHRMFVLESTAIESSSLITELKSAILNKRDFPSSFRCLKS